VLGLRRRFTLGLMIPLVAVLLPLLSSLPGEAMLCSLLYRWNWIISFRALLSVFCLPREAMLCDLLYAPYADGIE
jgi:hypothetical protein